MIELSMSPSAMVAELNLEIVQFRKEAISEVEGITLNHLVGKQSEPKIRNAEAASSRVQESIESQPTLRRRRRIGAISSGRRLKWVRYRILDR